MLLSNPLSEEKERNKRHNVVIPYVAEVSEKFRRTFSNHDRNYFTPKTQLPDINLTLLLRQSIAVRNVQIFTTVRPDNLSKNAWQNT